MQKLILPLVVVFLALSACSSDSDKQIKKAFIEYSKANLDNPSSVEIIKIDTVQRWSVKEKQDRMKKDTAKVFQIGRNTRDVNTAIILQISKLPQKDLETLRKADGFKSLITDVSGLLQEYLDLINSNYETFSFLVDFWDTPDTCILMRDITYRMNAKLYTCIAVFDESGKKINFYKIEEQDNMCISKFLKQCLLYTIYLGKEMDLWNQVMSKINELKDLVYTQTGVLIDLSDEKVKQVNSELRAQLEE